MSTELTDPPSLPLPGVERVYTVKSIFPTLQGEGKRAGTKAVFIRFAGCNLWSGLPAGRKEGKGECARWCDSDFAKGTPHTADEILNSADLLWKDRGGQKWCVITGGEPLLQLDRDLVDVLHTGGWKIAVETNGTLDPDITLETGTIPLLETVDWVTVSPKLGSTTKLLRGDELKVVIPGALPPDPGWTDEALLALAENGRFKHLLVQPQDPIDPREVEKSYLTKLGQSREMAGIYALTLQRCIAFIDRHPEWALSVQTHKTVGLP